MKAYMRLLIASLTAAALGLTVFMPYIAPFGMLTSGLLFLIFLYLVARKKLEIEIPFFLVIVLFLGIVTDVIGNSFGFFGKTFGPLPYDSWLHTFTPAYIAFSVAWVVNAIREKERWRVGNGFIWIVIFSITFSLVGIYEITELLDEQYFEGKRIWSVYDTSLDLQWGFIGTLIGMLAYQLVSKVRKGKKIKAA